MDNLQKLIYACSQPKVRQATYYRTPDAVTRCTRQRPIDRRCCRETFLVSIGKPNYYERRFIKACLKAGATFPVKKIQLKFYRE